LTLGDYQALSPAFEKDVFACFDLATAMQARRAPGAPSPENVAAQLRRWGEILGA
jgi:argininosuccinate lyase